MTWFRGARVAVATAVVTGGVFAATLTDVAQAQRQPQVTPPPAPGQQGQPGLPVVPVVPVPPGPQAQPGLPVLPQPGLPVQPGLQLQPGQQQAQAPRPVGFGNVVDELFLSTALLDSLEFGQLPALLQARVQGQQPRVVFLNDTLDQNQVAAIRQLIQESRVLRRAATLSQQAVRTAPQLQQFLQQNNIEPGQVVAINLVDQPITLFAFRQPIATQAQPGLPAVQPGQQVQPGLPVRPGLPGQQLQPGLPVQPSPRMQPGLPGQQVQPGLPGQPGQQLQPGQQPQGRQQPGQVQQPVQPQPGQPQAQPGQGQGQPQARQGQGQQGGQQQVGAACEVQQTPAGTERSISSLVRNAGNLRGEPAVITGQVAQVISQGVFLVGDGANQILVVNRNLGATMPFAGGAANVRVEGTAHTFNLQAFEQVVGADLPDQLTRYAGQAAIIATCIHTAGSAPQG